MNLYIRYFESEHLAYSLDDAYNFLTSIPDVDLDEYLAEDIKKYFESNNMIPKRYKVHGRAYFILIKTLANTLEEFKQAGLAAQENGARKNAEKMRLQDIYKTVNVGWYETNMTFRRVIQVPHTQKCQYVDTTFVARVKASSIQDSFTKVMDHLRTRTDIDARSQFPSMKGKNFKSVFLGMNPES